MGCGHIGIYCSNVLSLHLFSLLGHGLCVVCLQWMGLKGASPASDAHWSLQRSLTAADHTFSSSRNGKCGPSKRITVDLEQVRELIFVSEAIVVRVSSLLWDGGKSEINFQR